MRVPSARSARNRVAGLLAALVVIVMPAVALAYLPGPSPQIVTQILIAQHEGETGTPGEGAARLLALREELPAPSERTQQAAVDHAMLSLYAAALTSATGAHDAALRLFEGAAAEFAALGPGAAGVQALAMENAAALVGQLDGFAAGHARYLEARALRNRHGLPVDAAMIGALEQAGRLAQAMSDVPAVLEELRVTTETIAAIPPDAPLLQARAMSLGAQLAKTSGIYNVAQDSAGLAVFTAQNLLYVIESGAPGQDHAAQCTTLAPLLRDLLGLQIEIGAYAEAAQLLTFQMPNFWETCGAHVKAPHATRVNTLAARLYLRAGDPFAAHLRLRAAAVDLAADRTANVDDALTLGVIRLRQAEARLVLGFPGEAEALLAQVPAGLGLPETHVHERERLMVQARLQAAQGRRQDAAQTLAQAEELQREREPLHWYPSMGIAYLRALLLLESGARDEAAAIRNAFENRLSVYIAEVQAGERAVDAALADDRLEFMTSVFGRDFAQQHENDRRAGAFDHVGHRALERLRMLYELADAVASDNKQAARAAFDAVPERGLPSDTAFSGLAQAAYLRACYAGYGAGLRCETAASSAMDAPFAVPHACVGGCPWVMPGADELVVSAGMRRRGPTLDSYAEPVLQSQIAAANAAQAELLPAPDQEPSLAAAQRETARAIGRFAGAGAAFDLAQRRLEGRAAETVNQVGARLAAGDDTLGQLLRARDGLTGQLDMLFRDNGDPADDIAKLTAALDANRAELATLRPDHADLFDPAPLTPEEVTALLPDGAAFLMVSTTEAATYVFVVRDGNLGWWRAPLGRAALEAEVAALRVTLDPLAQDRGAKPLTDSGSSARAFDRRLAHRLYRDLIAPLGDMLAGADLHVVADGPLGALPLSVLVVSPPKGNDSDLEAMRATDWLVRHHAVTLHAAPTGLRLAALQRKRPRAPRAFIGFGDPVFAPRDAPGAAFSRLARLPGTRTEIEELATLFDGSQADVRLGRDATKAAVMAADLSTAQVIAFATHGLLARQMEGLEEPGLVFSAPPGQEGDPLSSYLTASEAATLDLNADWVLLSACDTAGPDGRPDSDGLSGLARAFLFAGARSVLVSHWPVRDDAAMLLTTIALRWQAQNPKTPRARALQASMLQVMHNQAIPELAHPSAWAPFILLGDG